MNCREGIAADGLRYGTGIERREKVRIEGPFLARVRGVDADGERFDIETSLENLSASGLFMRISRPVKERTAIFVVLKIPVRQGAHGSGTCWAAQGLVRRVQKLDGGWCGLGVKLTRYRET